MAAIPPGFDHNPTTYRRRARLAVLALAGLLVAGYLTLYQWDAWPVWDPFCTLCLVSAVLSLALFALGIGEARAASQHVRRELARGTALGDAVWGRYRAAELSMARRGIAADSGRGAVAREP